MISIHVDVDNLWNYEREFGAAPSGRYDALYRQALPLMLEIFARYRVRATFFLNACELERASCLEFCREALRHDHEIANHTLSHPTDLYRLTRAEKEREIIYSGKLIEDRLGSKVVGFRAPGYYLDDDIVDLLAENDYLYDTSVLPSCINALMGCYIALKTGRSIDKAFGRKRYAVASQGVTKVYSRSCPDHFFYELPISTLPVLRLPVHSTMIYLLGERYLTAVLHVLRTARRPSVYVFHAIDALEYTNDPVLTKNVPALQWPLARRVRLMERIFESCSRRQFVVARDLVAPERVAHVPTSMVLGWRMAAG